MSTSASRRTAKKKTSFDLDALKIIYKDTKSGIPYIRSVRYRGKLLKRIALGCRSIYRVDGAAIKIEVGETEQTIGEVKFYKRLDRRKVKYDLRYFPKLLAYDLNRGIVVQEYIEFKKGKRTLAQRAIIDRLIQKYQIHSDLDPEEDHNWGINSRNNLPVIYDLGFA